LAPGRGGAGGRAELIGHGGAGGNGWTNDSGVGQPDGSDGRWGNSGLLYGAGGAGGIAANAASSVTADVATPATSSDPSYFANLATLPFPIGAFNLNLGNILHIYNDGGILPWQFGFGIDLFSNNPLFHVIAESQGNEYGIASLINVDLGTLGFSNVQTYGNSVGGNTSIICDQFSLFGPGWTHIFTAKTGIFTNAPPAFEWSTPLFSWQTGSQIPDIIFPLESSWE